MSVTDLKLVYQALLFTLYFLSVSCSWATPRLSLRQDPQLIYSKNVSHTVFCLRNGSDNLLLGKIDHVLEVNDDGVVENYTLMGACRESPCEHIVTVVEEFQKNIFACGTNGRKPACWTLHPRDIYTTSMPGEIIDGSGISPFTSFQSSISFVADDDLYSAAPLYSDGTLVQFRRKMGIRAQLRMHDAWLKEPTFISAFLARRPEDPLNEKIYIFFREKTSESSPELDPWVSRVARVCKNDKGGPKRIFQNTWTTFLKARLVCAIPGESLYFNRLQDVSVLHSDNWKESHIYALFSSSWNATAVCIYSLYELDIIFEKSSFKGFNNEIPQPRPGTCVVDSRDLPNLTILTVMNNAEMTDWVLPIQKHAPFYIGDNHYTKITVDSVQALDEKVYSVLLLATDTGKIHKILEHNSTAFVISETSLCTGSAPVLAMKLSSKKRKLYVGCPGHMSVLDLQSCQDYNGSCEDCVLARDPYCVWTKNGCTSQTKGGVQNIPTGKPHMCSSKSAASPIVHTVPKGLPFYLSCPIDSHHATYSWKHRGKSIPCQRTPFGCLHLIPTVGAHDYGMYNCVSSELNYDKIVKVYQLHGSGTMSSGLPLRMYACWLFLLHLFRA